MADEKKRGRPAFKPTDEQRETVRVLKALTALTEAEIAAHLGISTPTLKRHFSQELKQASAAVAADVAIARFAAAMSGKVSAQNKIFEQLGIDAPAAAGAGRERKLGKKEQAAEKAKAIGVGKFATPPPPRLVVDNAKK